MVLGYDYSRQKRWWRQKDAPHPPAISMATAVRWSNTDSIARCGMSRATLEATGCRHRATTCFVLPQQLPGQQAYKQQSRITPAKLAILMAMAMCRYVTRVDCPIEEVQSFTRSHWMPPLGKYYAQEYCGDMALMVFFDVFIVKTIGKGHGLTLRPLFLIGV